MSRQSGQGLRATLSSLRSALSQSGPSAGRLQLTVSTSPPPPPPPPLAAGHPAEAEALLSPGRSGQVAAAAPSPPPTVHTTPSFPAAGVDATGGGTPSGLGAMGSDGPAASTQQAGGEAADVAAAAEQHRLTNAAASVDLRSLAIALERGLPYAALLLLLFISTHMVGIAVFAYLSWVLHRVNRLVRAQVALKAERSARTLLAMAAAVAAHVPLVLLALRGQDMAGNLVLRGSAPPTQFSDTVFAVVVGDTTLRFVAVLAKIAILLAAPADSTVQVRRRGHLLTCAEFVSQLYRMLPPAPLWYAFYAAQAAVPALLRTGLSGAYLLIKAQHFFERAALVALAVQQCAQRSYGSTPSAEERQEAGNCCPICQDAYREPTKLSCGHIFCNDCLSEWFERERTCPMCRAAVGPASKKFKSFSDGRTPIFPFLF